MAVKAHFAVAKLTKFFNDGSGVAANQKDAWREAQLAIYNHFVLTCDDRAATTLEAVDTTQDAVGWNTYLLFSPSMATPSVRSSASWYASILKESRVTRSRQQTTCPRCGQSSLKSRSTSRP